jgi:hypothetical protein
LHGCGVSEVPPDAAVNVVNLVRATERTATDVASGSILISSIKIGTDDPQEMSQRSTFPLEVIVKLLIGTL